MMTVMKGFGYCAKNVHYRILGERLRDPPVLYLIDNKNEGVVYLGEKATTAPPA